MMDEGTLRARFPEIPWDQPQQVTVLPRSMSTALAEANPLLVSATAASYWVCRYCVSMYGVKTVDLDKGRVPFAFDTRAKALVHVEEVHHD